MGKSIANRVLTSASSSLEEHTKAYEADPSAYAAEVLRLAAKDVDLASNTIVRACALCWRGERRDVVDALMPKMNFGEILNLVKMLDVERQIGALDRKLEQVKKRRKVAVLQQRRNELENVRIHSDTLQKGSASLSLMKRVRKWVQAITPERLEFFILQFDLSPWKELADLAHLRPSDFQLDYFLSVCFGGTAPEGSLVHKLQEGDLSNISALLEAHPQLATCYSFIRTMPSAANLTIESRLALGRVIPLSEIIWFYEELDCPGLDVIVKERIEKGEDIRDATGKNRDSFGKLMERMLSFVETKRHLAFLPGLRKIATKRLREVSIPTNARVAVLGDASSSMAIAVKSATIIGSIVCSALDGRLNFFTGEEVLPSIQPRSVDDVLFVADEIQACGCTSPAAALEPYYLRKDMVDLFIVVTDEGENTPCRGGESFAPLFQRYLREINPRATCFFVSFLSAFDDGYMMRAMQEAGLGEHVKQFRFHVDRPDLSKVTALLAMLAAEVESYAPPPVHRSCEEASCPIMCKDGPLLVTEEELAALQRIFSDVDTITSTSLLEMLPKLRNQPAESSNNDAQSVFTDWSIVDK
ncbi:Hypothetical Protein FCC1311_001602 [Hondaea fermentalgiana]|uniref:Uncharacterized protein n=1 Tax=Hondaea fermentalgiana TaxID=2315210 RepID=A0A2R5G7C6_9STRA|nr:Hypothetical Protein FCC1311_001602 [Hondaea fermentalgiana]|eukprot:GBG23941.1 Hypothetical Protein FCC1311_001602 [Hondaea fermentalgiana]